MRAQKKPVVIDYFDPTDYDGLLEWIKSFNDDPVNVLKTEHNCLFLHDDGIWYQITDDYIIREEIGVYTRCRKTRFHETYDDLDEVYIAIKGDHNDADYNTEISKVDMETALEIKNIINKLPKNDRNRIEYLDDDLEYIDYTKYLTQEESDLLEDYLPRYMADYGCIHTIISVDIFSKIEKVL